MSSRPETGIVTLADSNYFPGLEMLYRSVQDSMDMPVVCFDIGITEEQKAVAAREFPRLSILPLPGTPDIERVRTTFSSAAALRKAGKRVWPIWICPFLIHASPFPRVFWLDCDVVVLRNLRRLCELLDSGPVFTPENFAPDKTPNKPQLYDLMPIERAFDPLKPAVNAGVSGWDLARDRATLEAYMLPVRRACEDERVRDAISWWDQGCLIWAIQKTGQEHRVVDTNAWNLSVVHTVAADRSYTWDATVLDILRRDVPDANLLHWNGRPVPWKRPG